MNRIFASMTNDMYFTDDERLNKLIERFNRYTEQSLPMYFDVEELEDILDYYSEQWDDYKIEQVLQLALQIHPDHYYFNLRQAEMLFNRQYYTQAIKLLRELIQSDEQDLIALQLLAFSYQAMGQHKKAISTFIHALELGAHEADMWLNIAISYEQQEKYPIALRYLKKIVHQFPDDENAFQEILYCYQAMKTPEKAIDFMTEFNELFPYSALGKLFLGQAHLQNNDFKEAVKAYDFALNIDETLSEAHFQKSSALIMLGDFHSALENLQRCLLADNNNDEYHYRTGLCYYELDREKQALKEFKKTLELNPLHIDALGSLAMLYSSMGHHDKAIALLEDFLAENNEAPMIHIILGLLYAKLGKKTKLKKHVQQATLAADRLETMDEVLYLFFLNTFLKKKRLPLNILKKNQDFFAPIEYLALQYWFYRLHLSADEIEEKLKYHQENEHELIEMARSFLANLNYIELIENIL